MDAQALYKENKELKEEIEIFRKKQEYIDSGVLKTKQVYDIARYNAEKIITKAIEFVYDVKNDIENTLNKINANQNSFNKEVNEFLSRNEHFIIKDKAEIKNIADMVLKDIKI